MFPFSWLVGLLLPACAASGAAGLPVPPPIDFSAMVRPATPNSALAAPAVPGPHALTAGAPDIVTPVYPVPAARLLAAVQAMAAGQPRVFAAASYPERGQLDWVARSAVFNFPDLIVAQVAAEGAAEGADGSALVLYSRSVYGRSDLGVNLARLRVWLAAVNTMLMPATEKR